MIRIFLFQITISRSSSPEVFLKVFWKYAVNLQNTHTHGCSPVNLLVIFRTPFPKNTSWWLLLDKSFVDHETSLTDFKQVNNVLQFLHRESEPQITQKLNWLTLVYILLLKGLLFYLRLCFKLDSVLH